MKKSDIEKFAETFLDTALAIQGLSTRLTSKSPRSKCAQLGLLFRLCTGIHQNGRRILAQALHRTGIQGEENERVFGILTSLVPLLHNEAYQLSPHGVGQANFVLASHYKASSGIHAKELYWQVMGKGIYRQLIGLPESDQAGMADTAVMSSVSV